MTIPLKQEISRQNWEADDNKVKLMLSQLSFTLGFFQGIEELAHVEAIPSFINWSRGEKKKTVKHFIISLSLPTAFSLNVRKKKKKGHGIKMTSISTAVLCS